MPFHGVRKVNVKIDDNFPQYKPNQTTEWRIDIKMDTRLNSISIPFPTICPIPTLHLRTKADPFEQTKTDLPHFMHISCPGFPRHFDVQDSQTFSNFDGQLGYDPRGVHSLHAFDVVCLLCCFIHGITWI